METLISLTPLIAVVSAALACTWLVGRRLPTVRSSYIFAGVLWTAALASMWFIDTNVPLHLSRYRPDGEVAPPWLALLAFFLQAAAFASIYVTTYGHRRVQGVRLQLAAAYIDLGDKPSARKVLSKIIATGSPQEAEEAEALLAQIRD